MLVLPVLLFHAFPVHAGVIGLRGHALPGGVREFLGIRFASIPKRFEPSVPLPWPTDGTVSARSFGPDCIQPADMLQHTTSEDCLYLNVYQPPVPSSSSSSPLPVMAFVHGGGMVRGAGSWYNGSTLAASQRVLVVTFNYRLGPLGFASTNASSQHGTGGMNGVHDQITALQYLQENIHHLGGDPSRVTLFGQSAGGLSVCSLLFSHLARGLFHRAIIQSGSCTGPWGPGSKVAGIAATSRFLRAADESGKSTLKDIQDRERFPAAKLPSWSHGDLNALEFPGYWVDGWVLRGSPSSLQQHWQPPPPALINEGDAEDLLYTVPYDELDALLIGSNSRDGMLACCENPSSLPASLSAYAPALLNHWTKSVVSTLPRTTNSTALAQGVAEHYNPVDYGGTAAAAFVAADSDYNLYCPEFQMLAERKQQEGRDGTRKPRSYAYFWHYGPRCGVSPVPHSSPPVTGHDWAAHSAEVRFVFGASNGDPYGKSDENCPFSDEERQLSNITMDWWGSFARDGTPTASALLRQARALTPPWPTQDEGRVMEIRLTGGTVSAAGFRSSQCTFWQAWANLHK